MFNRNEDLRSFLSIERSANPAGSLQTDSPQFATVLYKTRRETRLDQAKRAQTPILAGLIRRSQCRGN